MNLRTVAIFLLLGFQPSFGATDPVYPDCVFLNEFEDLGTTAADPMAAVMVHNCARKQVSPPAPSRLARMTWDTSVATTAQTYTNQCHYQHSGTPGLGENIFASVSTVAGVVSTMKVASFDWGTEAFDYNYSANSCSGVCGHYTQMVWDTTTHLGCGLKYCPASSNPFQPPYDTYSWTFVVCNYSPAGNDGSRPY